MKKADEQTAAHHKWWSSWEVFTTVHYQVLFKQAVTKQIYRIFSPPPLSLQLNLFPYFVFCFFPPRGWSLQAITKSRTLRSRRSSVNVFARIRKNGECEREYVWERVSACVWVWMVCVHSRLSACAHEWVCARVQDSECVCACVQDGKSVNECLCVWDIECMCKRGSVCACARGKVRVCAYVWLTGRSMTSKWCWLALALFPLPKVTMYLFTDSILLACCRWGHSLPHNPISSSLLAKNKIYCLHNT